MVDVNVSFSSVSIPSGTSATLTVYEDTDGDGTAENQASTSLLDGLTSYTLSGFDDVDTNDTWFDVKLENTDKTVASTVSAPVDITLITSGTVLDAPEIVLNLSTPTPSVSAGAVTIDVGTTTLTAVTPTPSVEASNLLTASTATLTTVTPTPTVSAGTVTIDAGTTTLTAVTPSPAVGAGAVEVQAPVAEMSLSARTPTIRQVAAVSAPATTVSVSSPAPSVTPGATTAEMTVTEVLASAPTPAVNASNDVLAPVTTLSTSSPEPGVSIVFAVSVPSTTVSASSPKPAVEGGATTADAPATTVNVDSPSPAPTPGGVSVDVDAATLTSVSPEPALAIGDAVSVPVSTVQISSTEPSVTPGVATVTPTATTINASNPVPAFDAGATSFDAPVSTIATIAPTPVIGSGAIGVDGIPWKIAEYPFQPEAVEVDAKTVTLSGVAARYRLEQLRNVRAAAEKVDVVVDDEGRFRAVDRSRDGNTYLVEPPTDERPPRETADMLVADYSEERVSKQENKSEVTLTLQRPASRDATGDEPSQTRGTGEWLLEFHSGAIATRRITPERTSAVETAKDIESLQLVLTAEQTLVLETSATHPDAVSVVEVPDGTNLAQDNSSADRQTVEVTAATGKEGVLEGGTYVVAGWGSTRIDADSYEVSLDLRPEA